MSDPIQLQRSTIGQSSKTLAELQVEQGKLKSAPKELKLDIKSINKTLSDTSNLAQNALNEHYTPEQKTLRDNYINYQKELKGEVDQVNVNRKTMKSDLKKMDSSFSKSQEFIDGQLDQIKHYDKKMNEKGEAFYRTFGSTSKANEIRAQRTEKMNTTLKPEIVESKVASRKAEITKQQKTLEKAGQDLEHINTQFDKATKIVNTRMGMLEDIKNQIGELEDQVNAYKKEGKNKESYSSDFRKEFLNNKIPNLMSSKIDTLRGLAETISTEKINTSNDAEVNNQNEFNKKKLSELSHLKTELSNLKKATDERMQLAGKIHEETKSLTNTISSQTKDSKSNRLSKDLKAFVSSKNNMLISNKNSLKEIENKLINSDPNTKELSDKFEQIQKTDQKLAQSVDVAKSIRPKIGSDSLLKRTSMAVSHAFQIRKPLPSPPLNINDTNKLRDKLSEYSESILNVETQKSKSSGEIYSELNNLMHEIKNKNVDQNTYYLKAKVALLEQQFEKLSNLEKPKENAFQHLYHDKMNELEGVLKEYSKSIIQESQGEQRGSISVFKTNAEKAINQLQELINKVPEEFKGEINEKQFLDHKTNFENLQNVNPAVKLDAAHRAQNAIIEKETGQQIQQIHKIAKSLSDITKDSLRHIDAFLQDPHLHEHSPALQKVHELFSEYCAHSNDFLDIMYKFKENKGVKSSELLSAEQQVFEPSQKLDDALLKLQNLGFPVGSSLQAVGYERPQNAINDINRFLRHNGTFKEVNNSWTWNIGESKYIYDFTQNRLVSPKIDPRYQIIYNQDTKHFEAKAVSSEPTFDGPPDDLPPMLDPDGPPTDLPPVLDSDGPPTDLPPVLDSDGPPEDLPPDLPSDLREV